MDDALTTFPAGMRLDVRLCPGAESRLLRVTARWRDDSDAPPLSAGTRRVCDIAARFVAGVDAGLFHGPKDGQRAKLLHASGRTDGQGIDTDEWEVMTPPLDIDALVVLARMIWSTGGIELTLVQNAPEARLTVTSLDLPPRTDKAPPWEVVNEAIKGKDVVVTVCFEDDAPPEVVRATHATLTAWANIVAAGGFGGRSFPISLALLSEVGTELESEVFAAFEVLSVQHEGWATLWAGLQRIHSRAPIERVEIR